MKLSLTDHDFEQAAALLGCEVAAVRAVAEVESNGVGFCPDDFPRTLFEGHIFYRYTNGRYTTTHPTLCHVNFTNQFYGKTWREERYRLEEAIKLNRTAALMSASWGRFQIMGFNYTLCGCWNIQQFVNAMCRSEAEHLRLFCEYIVNIGLQDELQFEDWERFARLYNGPLYWKNQYDVRLKKACAKFNSTTVTPN